jgi:hypothetical protein
MELGNDQKKGQRPSCLVTSVGIGPVVQIFILNRKFKLLERLFATFQTKSLPGGRPVIDGFAFFDFTLAFGAGRIKFCRDFPWIIFI